MSDVGHLRRWSGHSNVAASLGEYEHVESFMGLPGFWSASRSFPDESRPRSFLMRIESSENGALLAHGQLVHNLQSEYFPTLTDLGKTEKLVYLAYQIQPPLELLSVHRPDGVAIAIHLARALAYLHEQGLVCRALRPQSIALTPAGLPVLFDLRSACGLPPDGRVSPATQLWPRSRYDAPESADTAFDGVKADIYSLGMLARKLGVPASYSSALDAMTARSPDDRPASMAEVVATLEAIQ